MKKKSKPKPKKNLALRRRRLIAKEVERLDNRITQSLNAIVKRDDAIRKLEAHCGTLQFQIREFDDEMRRLRVLCMDVLKMHETPSDPMKCCLNCGVPFAGHELRSVTCYVCKAPPGSPSAGNHAVRITPAEKIV